jgi:hypothetical protein
MASTVILWTEEGATIISEQGILRSPPSSSESETTITLIVVRPPFSVRIACQPMSDVGLSQIMELQVDPNHGTSLTTTRDAGRVLLTIIDPEGQTRDFDQVYDDLEKNDTIRTPVIVATSKEPDRQWERAEMEFRYPPIPRYAGFNVFGSLSRMKMDNALGTLQIGTKVYPLNVPSRLELNEIEAFRVQGGTMSFPVQLDLNREAAIFHLQATSKVFVNGDPLTTRLDDFRSFSDYMTLMFAAIGMLTGIAGCVIGLAQLRGK